MELTNFNPDYNLEARVIDEGEDVITPEMLKENLDVNKSLENIGLDFKPFQGRLLVKTFHLQDELQKCRYRTPGGLEYDVKHVQVNSNLMVGIILEIGQIFNMYTEKNFQYDFEKGDLIFFDAVKNTVVIPNEYYLIPPDSIYGTTRSYEIAAKMLSSVIRVGA